MLRTVLAIASVLVCSSAFASVAISGPDAAFSGPSPAQLAGYVLNPDGSETYFDNTSSHEIKYKTNQFVRWGSDSQVAAPGFNPSALLFIPISSFSGTANDGDLFNLGTLLFLNGNSELEKLIFGFDANHHCLDV